MPIAIIGARADMAVIARPSMVAFARAIVAVSVAGAWWHPRAFPKRAVPTHPARLALALKVLTQAVAVAVVGAAANAAIIAGESLVAEAGAVVAVAVAGAIIWAVAQGTVITCPARRTVAHGILTSSMPVTVAHTNRFGAVTTVKTRSTDTHPFVTGATRCAVIWAPN